MALRPVKIILWFLAGLFILIALAVVVAFTSPVQTAIVRRVLTDVNEGIEGQITFHRVHVTLSGLAILDSVSILDPDGARVVGLDRLKVRVNPLKILRQNTIHVTTLRADGIFADLVLDSTGTNLDRAFAPRDTTRRKPEDTTAAGPLKWIFELDDAELHGGQAVVRTPDSVLFRMQDWSLGLGGRFAHDSLRFDTEFNIPGALQLTAIGTSFWGGGLSQAEGRLTLHADTSLLKTLPPPSAAAGVVDLELDYITRNDTIFADTDLKGSALGRIEARLAAPFPLDDSLSGRGEIWLEEVTPGAFWGDTTAMVVSGNVHFAKFGTGSMTDGWDALVRLEASNYGRYHLTSTDLQIVLKDTTARIAGLLDTGHGRARIDALARGLNPQTMALQAKVDLQRMDLHRLVEQVPDSLGPLNGRIEINAPRVNPDNPQAAVALNLGSITFGQYHIDTLVTRADVQGKRFRVDTLYAALDTSIVGFSAVGRLDGDVRYTVYGEIPDFAALQSALRDAIPLDTIVQGAAELALTGGVSLARGKVSNLTAQGLLKLHHARYGAYYVDEALFAVDSALVDSLYMQGQVEVRHVEWDGPTVDSVMMAVHGTPARLGADLQMWALAETVYVATRFALERSPDRLALALDSLKATAYEVDARLENPAAIVLEGDRLEVGGLTIASEIGVLRASGFVSRRGEQDLTLELSALNTGEVARLTKLPLPESNTNIRLQLYGAQDDLAGEVGILSQDVRMTNVSVADELWLHSVVDQRHALVDGLVIWRGDTTLILEGELPARISFDEGFVLADTLPMSGRLQLLEQPLAKLNEYMQPGMSLGGRLSGDIRFGGTVAQPEWSGSFALHDGHYRDRAMGLDYRKMEIQGALVGDTLRIPNFDITSGRRGELDGSGWAVMSFPLPSELHLDLNFDGFEAVDNRNMEARMNGNIKVDGPLDRLDASGEIELTSGEYRISPAASKNIEEINLEAEMGLIEVDTTQRAPLDPKEIYRWMSHTLHLDIPGNAWIRGSGVNLELYGELYVNKDRNYDPSVNGEINVREEVSTVRFIGREFRVTEGTVRFTGPVDRPELNITAARELDDGREWTITVTGTPDNMQASIGGDTLGGVLASELRGSGEGGVAGSAAGAAAGQLSGLIGGAAGLDILQFRQGGTAEEGIFAGTLEVGTYVTDRLFIRVLQPIRTTQGGQEVRLEYRLLEWLKIRAQQEAEGSSALDLIFQYDWR